MTRTRIPAQVSRLIPRLASDYDAEVVATARAFARTLKAAGFDVHALAAVVERAPERERESEASRNIAQCKATANWCVEHDRARLNKRERAFVYAMAHAWNGTPTEKQVAWLRSIHVKLLSKERAQ